MSHEESSSAAQRPQAGVGGVADPSAISNDNATPIKSDLTRMTVQRQDPFNAESKPAELIAGHITPQTIFYVRNHGDVPALDPDHAIVIGSRSWNRAALERSFATHNVTATLQCAGNRRADLQEVAPTTGDPWDVGAIGNAIWTGVSLIDVLRDEGIADAGRFICFTAADTTSVEHQLAHFGVSIPLEKARDHDVLLVWAMNGEPLSPEHGAPLRLIVPGYGGMRSIKWLTHISISDEPSTAPVQAFDYKLFPASVRSAEDADWSNGLTINSLPLNSAICMPSDGQVLFDCAVTIKGYAMAYDRDVFRVEVSIDDGESWAQADLECDDDTHWSWTRWQIKAQLTKGPNTLVVRAVDSAGQGQPEHPAQVWNFAGYLASSWHRITVTAR